MASALARLPFRGGGKGKKTATKNKTEQPSSFVLATSRLFASTPAYVEDQPPFANAAAAVVTRLRPLELPRALKSLEREAGRGKERAAALRFGPRPLDLDVVFYGGLHGSFLESEEGDKGENDDDDDEDLDLASVSAAVAQGLELPHPRWRERAFVMAPVCDLVGGVEERESEGEGRRRRFGAALELFGFPPSDKDEQKQQQRRRRPCSLRPPGLPFPLPSRDSAEAVAASLFEAAQRWRDLTLSSNPSSPSPEADCRLGSGGDEEEDRAGASSSSSSCWPVLPLPHGFGGWRAQSRTPRIMAVLNLTPDSFSDGGKLLTKTTGEAKKGGRKIGSGSVENEKKERSAAFERSESDFPDDRPPDLPAVLAAAHAAVSAGADLLDVGGQSTRPGARKVPEEVEAARVLPVVRALAADQRLKDAKVPISVDTFYASVAERALRAGAHIINDVTGGKGDDDGEGGKMARAVARGKGVLILTHNRGGGSMKVEKKSSSSSSFDPTGGSADSDYGSYGGDVAVGVAAELAEAVESASTATERGKEEEESDDDETSLLLPWSLALDPGLGFSKTRAQNLSLLARTEDIRRALPPQLRTMPVLVGASRKGFLGEAVSGGGSEEKEEKKKSSGEEETEESSNLLHPRDAATFASSAIAAAHGADLLRVHEIPRNKESAGLGASVRWARGEEGKVERD